MVKQSNSNISQQRVTTYPRGCSCHPVRKKKQSQTNAIKDVLEHSDDLQSKDVLATVVANFEDSLLQNIIFDANLRTSCPFIQDGIRIGGNVDAFFANFESRHERCLIDAESHHKVV
jgi:hypothetical protein